MIRINKNYLKLESSYLFVDIARKVAAFEEAHPERRVVRLGIGDVTRPLVPAVIEALQRATAEQAEPGTFRGYGPEQGYAFLREAIAREVYAPLGVGMDIDEIFISDGAKSDTGNFLDILDPGSTVCLTDPIFPAYLDTNIMGGRAGDRQGEQWNRIIYAHCTEASDFKPCLPARHADIVYLCYPNNPTGTTLTRHELAAWVDYALSHDALLLYDAAYEAFISSGDVPHSIYEIPDARRCAVEFRSYSKTAGFTGLRCGYTVVPRELTVQGTPLRELWNRRQSTKYNGTPYIVQRAAEAVHSPEGRRQTQEVIGYYMRNASLMRRTLADLGLKAWGGVDAPYVWLRTPGGLGSWQFFDLLLHEAGVVCTPGVGFGPSGEGFVRLTAFGSHADCDEAMRRIRALSL